MCVNISSIKRIFSNQSHYFLDIPCIYVWKRNAGWIGHILWRNGLLKQVFEGKIKEEIEVKIRWGRRRRKLLDDLKERRRYSHLKEEALARTMWRNRFGRGVGHVVRMNEYMYDISVNIMTSIYKVKFPCSSVRPSGFENTRTSSLTTKVCSRRRKEPIV